MSWRGKRKYIWFDLIHAQALHKLLSRRKGYLTWGVGLVPYKSFETSEEPFSHPHPTLGSLPGELK